MILRSFALLAVLGGATAATGAPRECVQSPGKVIELCTWIDGGQAWYSVSRKGVSVLAPSTMGLGFAGEGEARYSALSNPRRAASNTIWEQPWGEQRVIRDNHSDLTVTIAGDTALTKSFDVTFRCSMTASVSAMPTLPYRPVRRWRSRRITPSSAWSGRIRPGGIRASARSVTNISTRRPTRAGSRWRKRR